MKRLFFIIISIIVAVCVQAQKLYVWEPRMQEIKPRPFFEEKDTIDLVIFDGRIITKQSHVKCSSEEVVGHIENDIMQAYRGATFVKHGTSDYNKSPYDNHITIKIGISAYHAGFGSDVDIAIGSVGGQFAYGISPKGKWNALTSLFVRVYDKRESQNKKKTKEIIHRASKPNMWGYSTAKNILNDTYIQAINELFFTIDDALMAE